MGKVKTADLLVDNDANLRTTDGDGKRRANHAFLL